MRASKPKKRLMVAVNVARCTGCLSCRIACAVEHSAAKELTALARSGERPGYRIHVEVCGDKAVPLHCSHCEEAACLMACPTGAIHRDEPGSPVLVDEARCIGCAMCVQACPFGVISLRVNGKGVLKCDLCAERLAAGAEPACVVACPTRALVALEEADVNRAKRRQTAVALVASRKE